MSSCTRPMCLACNFGKQTSRSTGAHQQLPTERAGGLRAGDLSSGDYVSIDQCYSSVRGRLPHTAGKEVKTKRFSGGTMFYDHGTHHIVVKQ